MAKVIINGDTSGSITLDAPAVAGTTTITLPATTGTAVVTTGNQTVEFADGSASAPSITNSGDTNTGMFFPAADTIAFSEGGVESMRIDSSGNVGIGTTSPLSRLQVVGQSGFGNGAANSATSISTTATGNDAVTLELATGSGSPFSLSLFAAGASPASAVYLNQRNNAPMVFQTNNTERMRITSSGDVLVGTTTADGRLTVVKSGDAITAKVLDNNNYSNYLGRNLSGTVTFTVAGTGQISAAFTTINSTSDQRLKENIQDLDVGLDAVMALKPRKFDWKEGKGKDIKGDRGFVAQEFEQVFPDLVGTSKYDVPEGEEPYKTVSADLIPVLVKAIQELKAQLDESNLTLTSVKAELDEAKAEIAALKEAK